MNPVWVWTYVAVEGVQFIGLAWVLLVAWRSAEEYRSVRQGSSCVPVQSILVEMEHLRGDINDRLERQEVEVALLSKHWRDTEIRMSGHDECLIALTREIQSLPTALAILVDKQAAEIKAHISLQVGDIRAAQVGLGKRVSALEEARYADAANGKASS